MTLEIVLTCVYDKLHVFFIKSHVFHNFIEETVLCGFCNIVKFKVKTFFLVCLSLRHAIFLGLSYQLAVCHYLSKSFKHWRDKGDNVVISRF